MSGTNSADQVRRNRRAGLVAVLFVAFVTVAVYLKPTPGASSYKLHAVFASTAQLHSGSPVRIAGVDVGRVSGIERSGIRDALVTMTIQPHGQPVRSDATLTVRPRLAVEGNAYVDLRPGTPGAEELASGATVPRSQTAYRVQVDQVLDVFDTSTLGGLHRAISELGTALSRPVGEWPSGGDALRDATVRFSRALPRVTEAARALRGRRGGDLSRTISGTRNVVAQLAEQPEALADFVSDYNTVFASLAEQDAALRRSVRELDGVMGAAPRALRNVAAALPALTQFSDRLRPALGTAPRPLRSADRLLDQLRAAAGPRELPALLNHLTPVAAALPSLEKRARALFKQTTPVTSCISSHIVPTLEMKIDDGPNTTGDPVYLDGFHATVGLAGYASAVDGNGGTLRFGTTNGGQTVDGVIGSLPVVGRVPSGTWVNPTWLGFGVVPPFRPDQACADQALPRLGARKGGAPSFVEKAGR